LHGRFADVRFTDGHPDGTVRIDGRFADGRCADGGLRPGNKMQVTIHGKDYSCYFEKIFNNVGDMPYQLS
jgi:hypothetical protein